MFDATALVLQEIWKSVVEPRRIKGSRVKAPQVSLTAMRVHAGDRQDKLRSDS